MSVVYLDTVGLIALWDESDQWHDLAEAAFLLLRKEQRSFVTTSSVLLECGNASSRRPYRAHVVHLMRQLESERSLIMPDESDWDLAWREFESGRPGSAGIVDCISFAVMRRLGISEVFTNDQHFQAAGFITLF